MIISRVYVITLLLICSIVASCCFSLHTDKGRVNWLHCVDGVGVISTLISVHNS